jgi:hypothetical protein
LIRLMAAPIEFRWFSEPIVQNQRQLDQRLKIKLRLFGPQALEHFAPILLPRAIKFGEKCLNKVFAGACGPAGFARFVNSGIAGAPVFTAIRGAVAVLHVRRSKRGTPSVHPIQGDELRALRRLQREQPPSPYVFCSERGGPMTAKSFHTLIARLGGRAGMPFPIHPHMLRHGCGYALANEGHDTRAIQAWMGHKNIQHTVRYTELAPDRFKDFWRN